MEPRLQQQYLLYMRQQQQQRQRHPLNNRHTSPHGGASARPAGVRPTGNTNVMGGPTHRHQVPQVCITSACDNKDSQVGEING